MLTLSYITDFALLHANIAYILIVLGVILEGEIVVILAGIFVHLGSLNIFVALGAIILGGSIKSVIGYSLGSYLQNNHSHMFILRKVERRIHHFLPHFNERPFWSIFLSRFLIFGIYWFALIFAGYKKTKMHIFIKAEIYSLIAWSIVMLSLGYFFSYTAIYISRDIRNFIGLILIFFIGFFILEKIIAFFVKLFENQEI